MLDHTTTYAPKFELLKQSFSKYHDVWPLWNPYGFSGMPALASGVFLGIDSWSGWLALILPTIAAVKINYILDFFLAGIFMYLLVFSVTKKKFAGFIAAIIYMFSGYTIRTLGGGLTQLNAYALTPLLFLFLIKTFQERQWIFYSVMTGIIFALQILSDPSLKIVLFNLVAFGLFLVFQLIGSNMKERFLKVVGVGIIVSVVLLGLSAQRVLPTKEYLDMTGRAHLPYEQSASRATPLSETFSTAIEPLKFGIRYDGREGLYKLGIVAFFFMLFALYAKPTRRLHLYLLATMILAISITSGSFVFKLLYTYVPPFDSFRYLERVFALFSFAGAFLAGLGVDLFTDTLEKRYELTRRGVYILSGVIFIIILLNLIVFTREPANYEEFPVQKIIDNNEILNYVAQQPGHFRIHTIETNGIDWGTDVYNAALGLEHIFSYSSTWLTEYMNEYLAIAQQYRPAKFWGILNVKYITSMQEMNSSDFILVKKFNECTICPIKNLLKAHGPYLYENKEFVPRAFFTQNAMLIIGQKEDSKKIMYSLLLDEHFQPNRMVAILSDTSTVDDYSIDTLKKYPVIILSQGSLSDQSAGILKQYVDGGGILVPDVTKGVTTIDQNSLDAVWKLFSTKDPRFVDDKDITRTDFNTYSLETKGKTGFLVMSELFSLYPGWKATDVASEYPILRANGVVSALFIDQSTETLTFSYRPFSYVLGTFITIISIILILGYFVYHFKLRKNDNVA